MDIVLLPTFWILSLISNTIFANADVFVYNGLFIGTLFASFLVCFGILARLHKNRRMKTVFALLFSWTCLLITRPVFEFFIDHLGTILAAGLEVLFLSTAFLLISKHFNQSLRFFKVIGIAMLVFECGRHGYVILTEHPFSKKGDIFQTGSSVLKNNERPNIYHILVDSFQAEALTYFIENEPKWKTVFAGFENFRNFQTNADMTTSSLGSLLNYRSFSQAKDMPSFLATKGERAELWTDLSANDYNVWLYTNFVSQCDQDAVLCQSSQELFHEIETPVGNRLIVDLWFHQMLTPTLSALLNRISDNSIGIFDANAAVTKAIKFSVTTFILGELPDDSMNGYYQASQKLLAQMTAEENFRGKTGQYIFLHTYTTHRPYVLDRNCNFLAKQAEINNESYLEQAHCALNEVESVLQKIKEQGKFENSMIIVHSDHGHFRFKEDELGSLSKYSTFDRGTYSDKMLLKVRDSASAMLLIKNSSSRVPYRENFAYVRPNVVWNAIQLQIGNDPLDANKSFHSEQSHSSFNIEKENWQLIESK